MNLASERSDGSIRHLLLTAVVLPIVLASLAGAWFAWQIKRISTVADWIDSSDRVIALVGDVQRLVGEREMGLRAFLFTADPLFLQSDQQTTPNADLDELEQLLSAQPAQAAEARALRDLYRRWSDEAEEAVASPVRGRSVAAIRERGAELDAMRVKSAGIVAQEKRTRLARTRRLEKETRLATLGAVTVLALLAGASSLASRRQIRLIGALMERERDALSKAREALRAKDAFLTNLSHELRTPLTPILGWVSLLRSKPLHGDALDRALASIERNARAEAQIVEDVLDISRIASGSLRVAPEAVEPATVVRAAIDVVELSARAKGIAIDAAIASPLPTILGDPARLRQIVWNLLSNAVKFTPRGGRVEIRVDRSEGGVRIRVADDGEGIAADFLPHVFEDFRQADPSITRAHGGLGLGLAIVKHLVELHGGEVEAESEGPGRGAAFTVTLPAAAPHSEALPNAAAPAPIDAPRKASLRGVRVLVVDDDPSARELFAAILRADGASVQLAASVADALGLLDKTSVDVVVSDLGMPGSSGYDLIGAIRESSALRRRLPALALTAYAGSEEASRALEAGFQMHMTKPVTPERLVGAVAQLVAGPTPS